MNNHSPNASRFEVFNVETGERLADWYFPDPYPHPKPRSRAFMYAQHCVLALPSKPLVVRLWERGNPVPTTVYSPHAL